MEGLSFTVVEGGYTEAEIDALVQGAYAQGKAVGLHLGKEQGLRRALFVAGSAVFLDKYMGTGKVDVIADITEALASELTGHVDGVKGI
jgi:hypothetical protein